MSGEQDEAVFLVCDQDGALANMQVKLFGREMVIPAMFLDEDDALHFLYEVEKQQLQNTYEIRKVSSELMLEAR